MSDRNFSVYVFRKRQLRFLRNVTRCYAKNIIVHTFASHSHRITIALPSYTNACVIRVICLIGVNSYPVTSKISVFRASKKGLKAILLHSHSSAMDTQTRWGLIEEASRTHWGGFRLYREVQSIAIIVPIILSYPEISRYKKEAYMRKRLLYFRKSD